MARTTRPTNGNTYAVNRFSPNGPAGYVAVFDDGSHGPIRETREHAEGDYTQVSTLMFDASRVDDLILFSVNSGELYDQRWAIEKVAQKRVDRGNPRDATETFITECFRMWLDTAAIQYGREIPDTPYPYFTDADKDEAARRLAHDTMKSASAGEFRA